MYRINYGNGQIHGPFSTLTEVIHEYQAQLEYDRKYHQSSHGMRIERYVGDGEWTTVRGTHRRR